MILTDSERIELCEHPANSDAIKTAKESQDVHKVHVTGEGYENYIKRIIGKENLEEYGQKKELAEPVTTSITKIVIDEQSRWQNAGVKHHFEFKSNANKEKEFQEQVLSQVWKGESMEYFIKNFVRDALYTEFNGFIIVEQGKIEQKGGVIYEIRDGKKSIVEKKQIKPYIIFRPIETIRDFESSGNHVEYIIIDWGKIKNDKIQLWRVIDDTEDVIVEQEGGEFTISKRKGYERIANRLNYPPALQVSTRPATPFADEVKTSYIWQTIPLLKTYLTQWAEHVITCILYSHPIFYQMGQGCKYEDDDGKCDEGTINFVVKGKPQTKDCPRCKGAGATADRDPSKPIILPQLDESGNAFNIANIAGFITPPVEALTEQRAELSWIEDKILRTGTGMDRMAETQIEKTATEAMINYKPLEEIIGEIIDNIEYVEKAVTDIIGKLFYGDKFIRSDATYDRNLNLRDENTVLLEIEQAKKSGASSSYVRTLHNELIHSRYQNAPIDLERNIMLSELEPFIGYIPEELNKYFEGFIDRDTMILKVYFTDYIVKFENEYTKITDFKENMILKDRVKLIRDIIDTYNKKVSERINKEVADANTKGAGDQTNGQ